MDKITVKAYAKINLSLDVLGKMPDGYHELRSIMQLVELHDDVEITRTKGKSKIKASSSKVFLPKDEKNIAGKAVRLFLDETGITGYDVSVFINKRNPVCAGLGGGSADGAAVLKGMNELFGTGLTLTQLEAMGEKLGADVPFCIRGGTVLCEGKGEIMTDAAPLPKCHIVICKPDASISTPELFHLIDSRKIRLRPDNDGMLSALKADSLNGVAKRVFNVFEELVAESCGDIKVIKDELYDYGALGASMSGTGSAVFGLFDDKSKAENAYYGLKKSYRECFLTENV
ncbi:MAG: 4-(cytidine 5'-diphospho)-2-C-methyl-D-erythritol kinase [Ruminococcaceae bacterium]|nr:4-(cytidine 5'-diphospho)-2-C-methyl-D-erythritol kinase [Oscillospiraceae bacterium]